MLLVGYSIAGNVAIAYSYKTGIASNCQRHIVGCCRYDASLTVDSRDANMLKVGAVGLPLVVVCLHFQGNSRTCSLYSLASDHLTICADYRFDIAWLVFYIFPDDDISMLCVVLGISLTSETLPVDDEFHFVGIGIGIYFQMFALTTVPMVAGLVVIETDTIPFGGVGRMVNDSQQYQRFVG